MQQRPNFRARQLGRELARLRRQAGLTQDQAGQPVRFPLRKMSRIESGQLPDYNGLRALLDVYGVPTSDWDPYLRLWEQAQKSGWWREYALADPKFISMEHEASALRDMTWSFVPGILQTPDYMRALFHTSNSSRKTVDQWVELRSRRQERLVTEPVLHFHTIIDEAVLTWGDDRRMLRSQLNTVMERSELPNVTVQLLPRRTAFHPGPLGTYAILSFPAKEDPDQLYVEHAFGWLYLDDRTQVLEAHRRFKGLGAQALSPQDSAATIHAMMSAL